MKREGSSSEGAVSLWALSFCQLPECNSRRFWSLSLQSLPSIPRRAQHTHTFSQINKHTHKTLRFFFRCKDISIFPKSEKREYSKLCYARRKKCVCVIQVLLVDLCSSSSFKTRVPRVARIFLFGLRNSFAENPSPKDDGSFSYLFALECKGFSYQIPSFPPVWDLCWVEYFVRSGPSFPRCGGTRTAHIHRSTHTHKLTCRRFVPAFLWAAKREEEDARVKTSRS